MTTGNDLITDARQHLRIHADEESLSANEKVKGFRALTNMLNMWVLDDVITSFTAALSTDEVILTFADATTLQDEVREALSSNLALRMAPDYGVQVFPAVYGMAKAGKETIVAKQHIATDTKASFDTTLLRMPSQRIYR